MATMLPGDITGLEGVTEGEIKVFRFLRDAAKPDRDFSCWYSPVIGIEGRTPDFLLFGKNLGLLVLEVKDWVLPQILAADFNRFIVRVSGKDETRTNPDKQAKGYVDALMERLQAIPDFRSVEAGKAGKLKIPIGRLVVFPNIRHRDFLDREPLPFIIPPERVLFQDDLDPGGSLLADTSGQSFRRRLDAVLLFKLKPLTPRETEKLNNLIWPEFIQLPSRLEDRKARFKQEVLALDEAQARLARRLGRGHQIIKGPPGSGKTLVLVHRCCQLRRYHPRIGRIMLVCFNIALASYLKRLLQEKGIGVGERGVEVCHFYELCAAVLKERVEFNQTDSEYYQLVIQETQEALASGKSHLGTFGAILVDEGQDFSNEMLQVVLGLLAPGGDLILALDSYQDLYRREASWRSAGIAARGRTHYLGNVYRNTFEIFEFSQLFIGVTPKKNSQARLQLDYFCHGDPPQLQQFADLDEIGAFLEIDIRKRISAGEYQRSEIAVIYDDKTYATGSFVYDRRDFPRRLRRRLEGAGIPVKWVSEDIRAKEMFDITTDRVSLVSIHSAKGLDFDLVYLVGVDLIIPTPDVWDFVLRLLYVAITRAKHRLVIPYVQEAGLINRILGCL